MPHAVKRWADRIPPNQSPSEFDAWILASAYQDRIHGWGTVDLLNRVGDHWVAIVRSDISHMPDSQIFVDGVTGVTWTPGGPTVLTPRIYGGNLRPSSAIAQLALPPVRRGWAPWTTSSFQGIALLRTLMPGFRIVPSEMKGEQKG